MPQSEISYSTIFEFNCSKTWLNTTSFREISNLLTPPMESSNNAHEDGIGSSPSSTSWLNTSFINCSILTACSCVLFTEVIVAVYPLPKRRFNCQERPTHCNSPPAMIAIRSHKTSASSMECVVKIIDLPAFESLITSHS